MENIVKQITHEQLKDVIRQYYKSKISLMIYGTFGIGKSHIIRAMAKEIAQQKERKYIEWNSINYAKKKEVVANPSQYFVMIDIRLSEYDSSDIKGLPDFNDEHSIIWKSPYWTQILEQPESDGFLFFDEMNLACFKKGTKILSKEGYKPIEDIQKDDRVLDIYGNYSKVLATQKTLYQGDIYTIKATSCEKLEATPNHPFLTIEKYRKSNEKWNIKESSSNIKWKKAENLKVGDYVAFSDIKQLETSSAITENWAKLLGMFVANGYTEKNKNSFRLALCYGKYKKEERKEVENILKQVFKNKRLGISDRYNAITYRITISENLYNYFNKVCGKYAENKIIPNFILNNPKEKILISFLDGYRKGDGCFIKNNQRSFISFATKSEKLALGLQQIFVRLKTQATINKDNKIRSCFIGNRKITYEGGYIIRVNNSEIQELFNLKPIKPKRETKHFFIYDNKLWIKIRQISKKQEFTEVFNFEVEGSNTYTANNICVHNTPLVLSSCYKIVYDRIINEGSISPNWLIISAGNLIDDRANTNDMPYPLRDRCGECMEAKTNIICKGDIKNISKIRKGDIVLDRFGEYNEVLETSKRKTNNLIEIKSTGKLPILLTKNHPILTKSNNGKSCWRLAEELEIGDKIGTPIIKGKDNSKINKDVASLLGFYTANGYKDNGKTKNRISLSFNSKHIKKIRLITKIISNNFTKKISILKRNDNSTNIQFYTNKAEWIENICGKYAKNKHIPYIILNNKNKKILESFLYGYYLGDGCFVSTKKQQYISFTTISKQLALELQLAFIRLGFFCNIQEDKKVRISKIGERTIKSCGDRFLIKTYDLQAGELFKVKMNKNYPTKHYKIEFGYLWTKIKSIKKIKKKCNVYNFEVDKSNSYIANNIVVHNCELLEPNHDTWINWAIENDIDYRIIGFINFSPSKLRVVNPDDNQKSTTPRCIGKNSKILMEDGNYKKIKDIQIGDKVIGFNGKNYVTSIVLKKFKKEISNQYIISDGKNTIASSGEHRFVTPFGYVMAKNLLKTKRYLNNLSQPILYGKEDTLDNRRNGISKTEFSQINKRGISKKIGKIKECNNQQDVLFEFKDLEYNTRQIQEPNTDGFSLFSRFVRWGRKYLSCQTKKEKYEYILRTSNLYPQLFGFIQGVVSEARILCKRRKTKKGLAKQVCSPFLWIQDKTFDRIIKSLLNFEKTTSIFNDRMDKTKTKIEQKWLGNKFCRFRNKENEEVKKNDKTFKFKTTEKIVSIRKIHNKEIFYDLMTSTQNYIAENFIVHNSWERVNALIKGIEEYPKLDLVVGTAIGEGVAREFLAFCKIKDEVQLDRILQFPQELKKVTQIDTKYFVISAVAEHYGKGNKVDFKKLLDISQALDEMCNPEFITLMWRLAVKYNPTKFRKDFQSKELDNPLRAKYNKYLMPNV